ncbi:hypothetical protein JXB37_00010 [candidate division WOR-3 bacterium]|nr:hypothetical protein [candidate division WOR-3 bacterium]
MIASRKSRAVGLFSGGLDSILAAKLVTEQGADAVALHFQVPFVSPGRPAGEARLKRLAELAGASLISVEVGSDYLAMVKAPKYGYARGMAPCVDCILYMLAKARELARQIDADFIFTGEVVGQRARCQNKRSLRLIEKAAGIEGRLLRPLSAKLLDPTIPELTGLVRRERLLDLKGRGRRRQIRLAHEFGIIEHAPPTGGCMLADRNFAARVRDAIEHDDFEPDSLDLLRPGRLFRLPGGARAVVGRNRRENEAIEALAREGDTVCRPVDVMGPVALLRARASDDADVAAVARLVARYSDGAPGRPVPVNCGGRELVVEPASEPEIADWLVAAKADAADEPDESEAAEDKENGNGD